MASFKLDSPILLSGRTEIITWGETVQRGHMVCQGATNQYVLTDSDDKEKPGASTPFGIALTGGSLSSLGVICREPGARVQVTAALEQGQIYVVSPTPGQICLQADLVTDINEIQEISNDATGGTFTLTFAGETTGPIPWDADTAEMTAALEALSNVDDVVCQFGSLASLPIEVIFRGVQVEGDIPLMTADSTNLTGGTANIQITEHTTGVEGDYLSIVGYAETDAILRLLLQRTTIQKK